MVAELQVPQDQLAHWLEEFSRQYHMVIQHRPGCRHCNADALTRLPVLPGDCGTRLEVICSVALVSPGAPYPTVDVVPER